MNFNSFNKSLYLKIDQYIIEENNEANTFKLEFILKNVTYFDFGYTYTYGKCWEHVAIEGVSLKKIDNNLYFTSIGTFIYYVKIKFEKIDLLIPYDKKLNFFYYWYWDMAAR